MVLRALFHFRATCRGRLLYGFFVGLVCGVSETGSQKKNARNNCRKCPNHQDCPRQRSDCAPVTVFANLYDSQTTAAWLICRGSDRKTGQSPAVCPVMCGTPPFPGQNLISLKGHKRSAVGGEFPNEGLLQVKGETIEGKYRVELVTRNGDGDCLREVLYRRDNLALVRAIFKGYVERYSGRVVVLYDRAQVLARSDT